MSASDGSHECPPIAELSDEQFEVERRKVEALLDAMRASNAKAMDWWTRPYLERPSRRLKSSSLKS
jgi:hypothetical protein